ncbi:uncharacterized protein LOC134743356 [Cydia strobilella]|uniref:uncharacterized protein LOC134743356 n=1 Tax=Cydia strobilella TaxID=1100964 RepID=UPI003006DC35
MKIYFSNDLAKQYLDLCKTSLSNISSKGDEKYGILFDRNSIFSSIYAIFQLGDEHTKTEFMDKHAPTTSKIEYDKLDKYLMYTQEAICRLHCYSRPPVPLAKAALYLKGDYVHLSNDMFNTYLMKLTPIPRSEFIKFLLDSPVSIQKRGLRLAFHAFETSELKDVISNMWKKTKNVSVRSKLYVSIVEKIKNEKRKSQLELFKLLKELTSHIHQDDDEELFKYFTGDKIPEYLRGEYLETAWKTVLASPENKANIQRRTDVAKAMKSNIVLINESHVEALVYGHVRKRLSQEELRPEENSHIEPLNDALWDFVVEYIVNVDTELKQEKRTLETSILALHMMPQDLSTISVAGNELQEVMKTIKNQNHEELNAFMNDKFIYSDCKVRKIMIT